MIVGALQVLGALLCTAGGLAASRRSRALGAAVGACSTLLLVLAALAGRIPAAGRILFDWDAYALVEPWWHLFPASLLAGAAWPGVRARLWKRDGLLVALGVLLVRSFTVAWADEQGHGELKGAPDASGICLQTSGYSCAPAAAAMYLHRLGVYATEREMAEQCVTRSASCLGPGTSFAGKLRGLRRKLGAGWTVDWDERPLDATPLPSLGAIRWSGILHAVVFLERTPDGGVALLDPLVGRREWTREEFDRERVGPVAWAVRRD